MLEPGVDDCVWCAWSSTETLGDQADLMAAWLVGEYDQTPGYCGPPDEETGDLVEPLLQIAACGLVPVGSQPACHDHEARQLPFVEVYGEEHLVRDLRARLQAAGIRVVAWPMSWTSPQGRFSDSIARFPVTWRWENATGWHESTWAGGGACYEDYLAALEERVQLTPDARAAMNRAWGLLAAGSQTQEEPDQFATRVAQTAIDATVAAEAEKASDPWT